MQHFNFRKFHTAIFSKKSGMLMRGQIVLITLVSLSSLILLVGITAAANSFYINQSTVLHKKGQEALYIAESGASDAISRLERDSNFSSSGYTIALGNGTSTVAIAFDKPSAGQDTIDAVGTVNSINRKVEVTIARSSPRLIISWQEIAN